MASQKRKIAKDSGTLSSVWQIKSQAKFDAMLLVKVQTLSKLPARSTVATSIRWCSYHFLRPLASALEHLALRPGRRRALAEAIPCFADYIGHPKGWPTHPR
jgi:hypothetical protein